ncbi:sensor domain-containing diguanylate cyclase [Paenibacillus sp. strain BS8-2]
MERRRNRLMGRRFKFHSLLAGLLAVTLITLTFVLITTSVRKQHQALTASMLQSNFEGARNLTISVNTIKDIMFRELGSTARYMAEEQIPMENSSKTLGALLVGNRLFNGALLIDNAGHVQSATPESGYIAGDSLEAVLLVQKPRARESGPQVTGTFESPTGKLLIMVLHPVGAPGREQSGFLAGLINLSERNIFSDMFEHAMKSSAGSFAYLVDKQGELLLNPDKSRQSRILPASIITETWGKPNVSSAITHDAEGEELFAGYLQVADAEWGVVFQSPVSAIDKAKAAIWKTQLSWSLPFAALVLALSVWAARRLAKPFVELTATARSIAAGERLNRPPFESHWNDEAHHLARAMITAMQSLQHEADRNSLLARTDRLTGLANRAGLEEWLSVPHHVSRGYALIVLDIDHFKSVNDKYGHHKGDETLVHLALLLQSECREDELVCRLGGEEFIVLLPMRDLREGTEFAERLRGRVEQTISPTGRPITVSIGVAVHGANGGGFDETFRLADEALFEAKRQGRNRTMASAG